MSLVNRQLAHRHAEDLVLKWPG